MLSNDRLGSADAYPGIQGNVQMLMQTGLAQCLFSAPVVKLLREKDGRVRGAVAQVGQDRYIKALARKGVVLSTGDYMSNAEMLRRFLPRHGRYSAIMAWER